MTTAKKCIFLGINSEDGVYMEQKKVIFQNETTSQGNGLDCLVEKGYSNLTIFITGTSTTRVVSFNALDEDGNLYNIVGYKVGDLNYTGAINTDGNDEAWHFDELQNYNSIRIAIDSISGGNITIKGVMT